EGAVVRSDHTTTLDLTLTVRLLGTTTERPIVRRHHQTSTTTVEGGGLRIAWSTNRHQALEPGHAHDLELPVVGPTWRLEGERVTRVDGEPVDPEAAAIVRQMRLPAQLTGIRAMLGDDPSIGDVLPAGSMFAGVLDDAPGEPELIAGTLRLVEIDGGKARFAVDLDLRSQGTDAKGTAIRTDARAAGELLVAVDTGLTERFALEGTVEVLATRTDLRTTGSGRFTTVTVLEHE
ncbi:MAG: hypothetical protein KC656_33810, partial [Myxococcales bacterium]|nr:hypothetical protein [Myxococcales bacterium]